MDCHTHSSFFLADRYVLVQENDPSQCWLHCITVTAVMYEYTVQHQVLPPGQQRYRWHRFTHHILNKGTTDCVFADVGTLLEGKIKIYNDWNFGVGVILMLGGNFEIWEGGR
jgi:hypothetical protein